MSSYWSILGYGLLALIALIWLYMAARLVSRAWYRTWKENKED